MQKVTLKLKINGTDKTAFITDRLTSLTVTDQAGLDSDTLSLTLDDHAPHIKLPPIKATLQLWLDQTYMGAWQVSELEADDQAGTLTIEATSPTTATPATTSSKPQPTKSVPTSLTPPH